MSENLGSSPSFCLVVKVSEISAFSFVLLVVGWGFLQLKNLHEQYYILLQ